MYFHKAFYSVNKVKPQIKYSTSNNYNLFILDIPIKYYLYILEWKVSREIIKF